MSIRTRTVPLQTKFPLWRARYKSLYNNSVIRASTKHRTIVMSSGVHGNRHLISVIEGTCGNRGDVALRASSVSGDKFDGSQVPLRGVARAVPTYCDGYRNRNLVFIPQLCFQADACELKNQKMATSKKATRNTGDALAETVRLKTSGLYADVSRPRCDGNAEANSPGPL
jgi:hypothetical protein